MCPTYNHSDRFEPEFGDSDRGYNFERELLNDAKCWDKFCAKGVSRTMKLDAVLANLLDFFRREKIAYAVIGAFALKAYGYVRATRDILP